MRGEVQGVLARAEEATCVLLPDVLPPTSPCWDITVEEDHSFICEGVILHNCLGNCRCYLVSEGAFESGLINQVGVEVTSIGSLEVDPMSVAAIAAAELYHELAERYVYHMRMSLVDPAGGHGRLARLIKQDMKRLAEQLGHSVRFSVTQKEMLDQVRLAKALGYRFIAPGDLSDDLVLAVATVLAMNSSFRGKITEVRESPPTVVLDDTDEFRLDEMGRNMLFTVP